MLSLRNSVVKPYLHLNALQIFGVHDDFYEIPSSEAFRSDLT